MAKTFHSTLLFLWLWTPSLHAQGDDNLLLQYNRGPTFESLYHPWNVELHYLGVRMNTPLEFTRPRLTWGAGMLLQHKFNKTLGLATGAFYTNIHYRYQREDLDSKDFLAFWRVPIQLQFSPNDHVQLSFGPTYNLLHHAYNSEVVRFIEESRPPFLFIYASNYYAPGHFKNAFGILAAASYRFWKGFALRVEYMQIRKTDDPFTIQSNTFRGVNLGLQWFFLNPSKHNENDIR